MSTQKETIDYILEELGSCERFTTRAMFGEYALYADKKVVGLVCDNLLYIKITPESSELEAVCEKDAPYTGAKDWYLVEEDQLRSLEDLPDILFAIAKNVPVPNAKVKKPKSRK